MAKLSFRQAAIDDLSDIYHYSVRMWSFEQADKYYHLIRSACLDLASGVALGRDFSVILPNLFAYHIGKHMVFYTLDGNRLQVIRILHERMDYQRHLR